MNENKIKFWGEIDQIARLLEAVADQHKGLWEGGEYRMRAEDMERLSCYLLRVRLSYSKMRDCMILFRALLDRIPNNEKNLQKLSALTETEAVEA